MKRRILITSAIPYVAGVKHLGNLAGATLGVPVAGDIFVDVWEEWDKTAKEAQRRADEPRRRECPAEVLAGAEVEHAAARTEQRVDLCLDGRRVGRSERRDDLDRPDPLVPAHSTGDASADRAGIPSRVTLRA